ncbi:MAG: response regulator [Limisphaerales bacterium]
MGELFPVLLAEDDSNDVFLLKRALKAAGVTNPVFVVRDGQEALDYLQGTGNFSDRSRFPVPGVIFLDIKMPRKNGFEVLQWIREASSIKSAAVVITSSSQLPADIERGQALGANFYLPKPIRPDSLKQLFADLGELSAATRHAHA